MVEERYVTGITFKAMVTGKWLAASPHQTNHSSSSVWIEFFKATFRELGPKRLKRAKDPINFIGIGISKKGEYIG